jgi:hypothetical protein
LKYDFNVNIKNIPCHLDVERDLKLQANGVFTFTVRVNQGLIMDYVNYYNPGPEDYRAIFDAVGTECTVTRSSGDDGPKS